MSDARIVRLYVLAVACVAMLGACTPILGDRHGVRVPTASLENTNWMLVQFESPDDAIGTVRPADQTQYKMSLGAGGRVTLDLECLHASGHWSVSESSSGHGTFLLGPLTMTNGECRAGSLATSIARDAEFVRSYILEGQSLHVSLMADGGVYTWRRTER